MQNKHAHFLLWWSNICLFSLTHRIWFLLPPEYSKFHITIYSAAVGPRYQFVGGWPKKHSRVRLSETESGWNYHVRGRGSHLWPTSDRDSIHFRGVTGGPGRLHCLHELWQEDCRGEGSRLQLWIGHGTLSVLTAWFEPRPNASVTFTKGLEAPRHEHSTRDNFEPSSA